MTLLFVVLLGVFGHITYGIPLEGPSDNFEPFFPLIVGGVDIEQQPPHMGAILVGSIFTSLMCGCSIIAPRKVLTAAHCIDPLIGWDGKVIDSSHIVVGTSRWNQGGHRANIKDFKKHPDYDGWLIKNDIGIFELIIDLVFNKHIAPIPLCTENLEGGEHCSVTGWGRLQAGGSLPNQLQYLKVRAMSHHECEIAMKKAVAGTGMWAPPIDAKIEVCALHDKGSGSGMCNGDSGSAMYKRCGKKYCQVGVVSWGFPCALGIPDVFVRVIAFNGWLKKYDENIQLCHG